MITYETLRNLEHDERTSAKLAKLPLNFLGEVRDYIESKEKLAREMGDKYEIQTAVQRFKNIVEIRERKIVNFTLSFIRSGVIPENMLPEESELFNSIVSSLESFEEKRRNALKAERTRFQSVAFLQPLPQFVGIDMGYYGPYSSGDIATVPEENARVLVEKGVAEAIESR